MFYDTLMTLSSKDLPGSKLNSVYQVFQMLVRKEHYSIDPYFLASVVGLTNKLSTNILLHCFSEGYCELFAKVTCDDCESFYDVIKPSSLDNFPHSYECEFCDEVIELELNKTELLFGILHDKWDSKEKKKLGIPKRQLSNPQFLKGRKQTSLPSV